jgi:O-antigen ligase
MRRALSAVNPVDFSWRNRVAAWEGALQITAEHPLFGTNWSQPESLYEHLYLVPRLSESVAIEMNDYLMLGATLGFPALGCFAMYVWMTLGRKAEIEKSGKLETDICELDWLQTTCHAGAIVLLVGFWFDGGLFKLPTAATFWILLELGAVPPQNYLTAKNAENTEIKTAII